MDQSSFAAPQGISQRTTSFIASQRQGIHQMLLRHLITLTIDVRMPSAKRADMIIKERPVLGFLPRHLFACQAYPARTAAGRRWFAGLGARSPNMLPLYDFKHPRLSHDERTRTSDKIHPKMDTGYFNTTQGKWWSLSGSNRRPEACKATALPAELRPRSGEWCLANGESTFQVPIRHPHSLFADNGGPGTTRTSDLTLIRGAL